MPASRALRVVPLAVLPASTATYRPTAVGSATVRAAPYAPQHGAPQQSRSDPAQLAALETLLRTIAQKAQSMSTAEILALNAAFSVASSSSTAPAEPVRPVQQGGAAGLIEMPVGSNGGRFASSSAGARSTGSSAVVASQTVQPLPAAEAGGAQPTGPLPTLEEVGGGLNTVKVSARANVKSVAGALSKSLRNHDMLVATAVGPEGTNHGMKALSIARCYLAAEGLDLSATVVEVQPDGSVNGQGRCYAFVVVRIPVPAKTGEPLCEAGVGRTEPMPRFVRPEALQTDMKVSGSGNASTLGGAIAKCLREDREVIITAVGPAAVAKCVEAMALARSYVWSDGLQLAFYPGFEHIIMQGVGPGAGEQRSCVRVHVWPEVAQPEDTAAGGNSRSSEWAA